MKILMINSVCGIRSTGRIVTDAAMSYMAQGHECRIAYGREDAPEPFKKYAYRIGTQWDVRRNALKARLFDNEGFHAKRETQNFLEWADRYDPDLLCLHNLHGYYINLELLFNWIKSRPQMQVEWTLHDCWAFTGHCAYFSFIKCDKWTTGCNHCQQINKYPASILRDNAENNYTRKRELFCGVKHMTLITPSKWLADLVKDSFLREYPVRIQYNTIDTNIFKPTVSDFRSKMKLEQKKIVLGVAAVWDDRKGLRDFLKLADMLEDPYTIVLVGVDPRQKITNQKNLICLPRTNSARELAEIYSASDVFINLTYEDNYPTVNLEAQACGIPCLTYRTGGSVESVPDQHIVEQGDLETLVAKIKQICTEK